MANTSEFGLRYMKNQLVNVACKIIRVHLKNELAEHMALFFNIFGTIVYKSRLAMSDVMTTCAKKDVERGTIKNGVFLSYVVIDKKHDLYPSYAGKYKPIDCNIAADGSVVVSVNKKEEHQDDSESDCAKLNECIEENLILDKA